MNTPKTDAVHNYLRTRSSYEKTDNQVWREHAETLETQLNQALKQVSAYYVQLASVMPPDFREWHNATPTERPIVAKLFIERLQHQLRLHEGHLEKPFQDPRIVGSTF